YDFFFFFSSRRRHTRFSRDWSSDVCSSDLGFRILRHSRLSTDTPTAPSSASSINFTQRLPSKERYPHISLTLMCFMILRQHRVRSEERRVGKECILRRWVDICKERELMKLV